MLDLSQFLREEISVGNLEQNCLIRLICSNAMPDQLLVAIVQMQGQLLDDLGFALPESSYPEESDDSSAAVAVPPFPPSDPESNGAFPNGKAADRARRH